MWSSWWTTITANSCADIYLQPILGIYPDIELSFVLELKNLPSRVTDAEVAAVCEKAWPCAQSTQKWRFS